MKKIAEGNNPHVVNMIGAVTLQEPMLLVLEFMKYGDLLNYLRACKKQVRYILYTDNNVNDSYRSYNPLNYIAVKFKSVIISVHALK